MVFDRIKGFLTGGRKSAPGPAGSPEEDIVLAGTALARGDLPHAAFHVGAALMTDANRLEWLALLDSIILCAPEPLLLAPLGPRNFAGTVGVRAYVLAHLGRYAEALAALVQAAASVPEAGYLAWAIAWLRSPAARDSVDVSPLLGLLGKLGAPEEQALLTEAAKRATVDRIPGVIAAACEGQKPTTQQVFLFVVVLKRMGCLDEAEAIASARHGAAPDFHTANAMASVCRARGRLEDAVAMYRLASKYDSDDPAVRLDAGDLLDELGRPAEAAAAYSEVLVWEQAHPWARPSYLVAKYRETGDDVWKTRFLAYLQANPANERAHQLQHVFSDYFGNVLPTPGEATLQGIRHLVSGAADAPKEVTGPLSVGLSSLEAPSAMLAANRELARCFGPAACLKIEVEVPRSADPRAARVPGGACLWRYEGVSAVPAAGPPSGEVLEAVRALASTPYSPQAWWHSAERPAAAISAGRADQLLRAMVHPTPAPEGMAAWDWIYRLQFAAAFLLARVDRGWTNSARRAALLSLAGGQMDWTVDAAVVALALVAEDAPEAEPEITQVYLSLIHHAVSVPGYVCCLEPSLVSLLHLPHLAGNLRTWAMDLLWKMRAGRGPGAL